MTLMAGAEWKANREMKQFSSQGSRGAPQINRLPNETKKGHTLLTNTAKYNITVLKNPKKAS